MPKKYVGIRTVVKNGHTYKVARLHFPFDEELGYKPAPKDFYGKTDAEADRKRREYKPEKKDVDLSVSFIDYIEKTFLKEQEVKATIGNRADGGISWRYYEHRLWRMKKYILDPEIESLKHLKIRSVRLGALQPNHIEQFFKAVEKEMVRSEDRHRLRDDLKACLKSAKSKLPHPVRLYFDDVEVPALKKRIKPVAVYDPSIIFKVVTDERKPIHDRCLVAFQFITQCRPQELFALNWDDFDLHNGSVTFWKKVTKTAKGWVIVDGTKTGDKGVRTIALGNFLTNLLKQHKLVQKKNKGNFVFTTRRGEMLHKERFKDLWPQVRESLKLPDGPTFYSLKHLGNSFALANGSTTQAQSQKMGHTTDRMAREIYRETLDSEKIKAVSVFDSQFIPQLTGETA